MDNSVKSQKLSSLSYQLESVVCDLVDFKQISETMMNSQCHYVDMYRDSSPPMEVATSMIFTTITVIFACILDSFVFPVAEGVQSREVQDTLKLYKNVQHVTVSLAWYSIQPTKFKIKRVKTVNILKHLKRTLRNADY